MRHSRRLSPSRRSLLLGVCGFLSSSTSQSLRAIDTSETTGSMARKRRRGEQEDDYQTDSDVGHMKAHKIGSGIFSTRWSEVIEVVFKSNDGSNVSFTIHKHVLTQHSPYFHKALRPPWTEAGTQRIELHKDDSNFVDTFPAYCNYVYQNSAHQIEIVTALIDFLPVELRLSIGTRSRPYQNWRRTLYLARLWVMVDRFMDFGCCDVVAIALGRLTLENPVDSLNGQVLRYVYDNTLPKSPLRKLIIDIVTFLSGWKTHAWADAPTEFLLELVTAFNKAKDIEQSRLAAGNNGRKMIEQRLERGVYSRSI